MRRMKQDQGLDVVAEGLNTLQNMTHGMNEEIDRQAPLMDAIDEKVDRATSDLKTTNVRLKDTVTQLRSSRNFCVDVILLCIILGIAAYLYNVLKVMLVFKQHLPRLLYEYFMISTRFFHGFWLRLPISIHLFILYEFLCMCYTWICLYI